MFHPPLTSIYDTPNVVIDAFCQTNSAGGGGDCPRRVCVRLPCHVDARTGDAMLRYDALLIPRPPAQPGMLQDDAVHARAFCTAGFDAWLILHTRFRRRAPGV